MKSLRSLSFLIAGIVCLGTAQAVRAQLSGQVTGQVYEISMAGGIATAQSVSSNQDVVATAKFTADNIINLALGQPTTDPVPANQKLALVLVFNENGDPTGSLIVYDTNTGSNLVTIAEVDLGGAIDSAKGKGFIAMAGGLNNIGNLNSGWVAMSGKAVVTGTDTAAPQVSFNGAVQGLFRGNDGEDFEVVVTKGKASVVGRLGILLFSIF